MHVWKRTRTCIRDRDSFFFRIFCFSSLPGTKTIRRGRGKSFICRNILFSASVSFLLLFVFFLLLSPTPSTIICTNSSLIFDFAVLQSSTFTRSPAPKVYHLLPASPCSHISPQSTSLLSLPSFLSLLFLTVTYSGVLVFFLPFSFSFLFSKFVMHLFSLSVFLCYFLNSLFVQIGCVHFFYMYVGILCIL